MSEYERNESKTVGAFLLGFLTGVLVCAGVGGGFFIVVSRNQLARAQEAMMEAQAARDMAEVARREAEVQRRVAEEAALKARQDKDKE